MQSKAVHLENGHSWVASTAGLPLPLPPLRRRPTLPHLRQPLNLLQLRVKRHRLPHRRAGRQTRFRSCRTSLHRSTPSKRDKAVSSKVLVSRVLPRVDSRAHTTLPSLRADGRPHAGRHPPASLLPIPSAPRNLDSLPPSRRPTDRRLPPPSRRKHRVPSSRRVARRSIEDWSARELCGSSRAAG